MPTKVVTVPIKVKVTTSRGGALKYAGGAKKRKGKRGGAVVSLI